MDEKTITIVKEKVEQLLKQMGFSGEVSISHFDDENIVCNITTDTDSHFLIGQHGMNLQAVQHIARLIVRKNTDEKVRFVLDVNSYVQQKNQSVIEMAHMAANDALNQHRSILMKPMSTYERRLVHLELSKNSNVSTESIGEGEDRKIVVKPADMIE